MSWPELVSCWCSAYSHGAASFHRGTILQSKLPDFTGTLSTSSGFFFSRSFIWPDTDDANHHAPTQTLLENLHRAHALARAHVGHRLHQSWPIQSRSEERRVGKERKT